MTREELIAIANGLGASHVVSRFKSCLKGFRDCSAFLSATDGELMKAYDEERPDSSKGLGKKFWSLMSKVRAAVKERAFREQKELDEKMRREDEERKAQELEKKAKEAEVFTYKQLRAITAFMELGGIDRIDLRAFRAFCDSVHVSPDLTKDGADVGNGAACAGAIGGKAVAA